MMPLFYISTELSKLAEMMLRGEQTVKYRFIVTFNGAQKFEFHLKLIKLIN